jgi:hypothetical protein
VKYKAAAAVYVLARAGRPLTVAEIDRRIGALTFDEGRGIEEARRTRQGIACLQVGKVVAAGRPVEVGSG